MNSVPKQILRTLGAIALGVLSSCGSKVPEEPFPQDRNVGGFQVPDPRSGMVFPDSLSGWNLTWNAPSSTSGLHQYYLFDDTLTGAMVERLINGSHALDLTDLPRCQILTVSDPSKDTAWEIPARWLDGKRQNEVSKTREFRFSIWARYLDGPIGQVVQYSFFLGDRSAPSLPAAAEIVDSIGGTRIVLKFPRPRDQTGRFDTLLRGPLRSVDFLVWPGNTQFDSAGKVVRWKVPSEDVADLSKDTLEIAFDRLRFYTPYVVVMEAVDSVGNVARSPQMQYRTRDSLPPSEVQALKAVAAGNRLTVGWIAATDTFGADNKPLLGSHPNQGIAKYRVVLDGKPVDSIDLRSQMEVFVAKDSAVAFEQGRFAWRRPTWTWTWPNLRPGQSYLVQIEVEDVSGNRSLAPARVSGVSSGISDVTCPKGYVAVRGDTLPGLGRLHDYCIEEHEHARGDTAISRVTWTQAQAICEQAGARLCSEAQWVRACEATPDDSRIYPYGAMEVGAGDDSDSLAWMQSACQLGTGDSTRARAVSNADPRCVSSWGVYDLPGRLGEWTLDVYSTTKNPSGWDSGTLAYRGPSDLTGKADLGTLHGGSVLVLQEVAQTLGSAKCRTRNYPASVELDTLKPQGGVRRRPNPDGTSLGWGFRCCVTF